MALKGKAFEVLVDLVEAALQRRYGRRVFMDNARDQLASRCRGERESLGAFAADLRLYAQRGYPTFSGSQQEELALQAFVRGIQLQRLREHIRLTTPCSLGEAMDEAKAKRNLKLHGRQPQPLCSETGVNPGGLRRTMAVTGVAKLGTSPEIVQHPRPSQPLTRQTARR